MATRAKRIAWFGVSTLILAALLYLADFSRVVSILRTVNLWYFSLAFLSGTGTFLVFAFTWHRFFGITGYPMKYFRSLRIYIAGEFLNSITPVGQFGGEPFMAYVISDNTDMAYEEALSTVLSADIINSVPIVTFVIGGFMYMLLFGTVGDFLLRAAIFVIVTVAVGASVTYALWFRPDVVERKIVGFFQMITGHLGRGQKYVRGLEERMEGVRETFDVIGAEKSALLSTAIIAHSYFLFALTSLYMVMISLGLEPGVAPLIFVLAFSGFSNFMPTPGGSGAYELAMAAILTLFLDISFAAATATAILFRLCGYWPALIAGYISLLTLEGGRT